MYTFTGHIANIGQKKEPLRTSFFRHKSFLEQNNKIIFLPLTTKENRGAYAFQPYSDKKEYNM